MHPNSLKIMSSLLDKYAPPSGLCVDVGSQDINGTYRPLVEGRGFTYLGVDISAGKNVDLVLPETIGWSMTCEWESQLSEYDPDFVISGQCLEHTKRPWEWIQAVVTAAHRPGVPFILIAPAAWPQHRYPVDCWRILPDGMQGLMEWAGLEVLEVGMDDPTGKRTHVDCWGVGSSSLCPLSPDDRHGRSQSSLVVPVSSRRFPE